MGPRRQSAASALVLLLRDRRRLARPGTGDGSGILPWLAVDAGVAGGQVAFELLGPVQQPSCGLSEPGREVAASTASTALLLVHPLIGSAQGLTQGLFLALGGATDPDGRGNLEVSAGVRDGL